MVRANRIVAVSQIAQVFLVTSFHATTLIAQDMAFEIDPQRSFITATSVISAAGLTSVPQGEGADKSAYSGSVLVRLDNLLNPGSIEFVTAEIFAEAGGEWLPERGGGIAGNPGDAYPAEFGFLFQVPDGYVLSAIRDSVITMTSEIIPVNGDGTFQSLQHVETTGGAYELNAATSILGGDVVTSTNLFDDPGVDDNVAVDLSSIVVGADGVTTLTIPLDLTFSQGGIDLTFLGIFVGTNGEPTTMRIPGDANEDGRVDAQDLNAVGINWQSNGKSWSDGDFTGDGFVNAADLNVLGVNWQTGVPIVGVPGAALLSAALLSAAPVPEPAFHPFYVMALYVALRLRRR